MFGFGFLEMPRPFNTQYRCYSVSMLPGQERQDVEKGGKIIMPPSALDQLTRLHIVYPMLFKLTNPREGRITHCGVLEFVADESKIYLPYWMKVICLTLKVHHYLLQPSPSFNHSLKTFWISAITKLF
ncbi:ubiquitin recognition factor in ER-associated degradation protein 1-like [Daphnia magna]|uniref:ubiquitin recognition factor in ER-associated degradation protein 1-like n=1 Tax=Daphnia magna TaxID=35525 RepID=UPI001E1BD9AD|nr:ubiquitin recognition factor in ER-associated degradation protein 1-like [Daphnia magna]